MRGCEDKLKNTQRTNNARSFGRLRYKMPSRSRAWTQHSRLVTYRFADPEYEEDAFGALVYTMPSVPELDDALSAESETRLAVKVGNLLFPVFGRPARWEFHQLPQVHPANGTAACGAKSLKPAFRKKLDC